VVMTVLLINDHDLGIVNLICSGFNLEMKSGRRTLRRPRTFTHQHEADLSRANVAAS
jgi:hypothetical protein